MNPFRWLWSHKRLVLVLVVLVVGIFGYRNYQQAKAIPTREVTKPELRDIRDTLDVSGKVYADRVAVLHFQTGGKLTSVPVKTGDHVKKGQLIAALDKAAIQKQLQKTLNNYRAGRINFDQNQEDYNEVFLSKEISRAIENNQINLENSVLDVELQDLALRLANIYAPIDGIVTQMSTQVPQVNIGPTDTFTVVDPESLYFQAQVDETDLSRVQEGKKAEISLDAFPELKMTSMVTQIDFGSSIGESGGTVYNIKLALEPGKADYRLGLNGQASLINEEKQHVLSIPIDALINRDGKTIVKVLVEDKEVEKAIVTGIESVDYVEVREGLNENDQVIIPK